MGGAVTLALMRAYLASMSATRQHAFGNCASIARKSSGNTRGGGANVAAIEANANTLRHIVHLCEAGVCATVTHFRAVHGVMYGEGPPFIAGHLS